MKTLLVNIRFFKIIFIGELWRVMFPIMSFQKSESCWDKWSTSLLKHRSNKAVNQYPLVAYSLASTLNITLFWCVTSVSHGSLTRFFFHSKVSSVERPEEKYQAFLLLNKESRTLALLLYKITPHQVFSILMSFEVFLNF